MGWGYFYVETTFMCSPSRAGGVAGMFRLNADAGSHGYTRSDSHIRAYRDTHAGAYTHVYRDTHADAVPSGDDSIGRW